MLLWQSQLLQMQPRRLQQLFIFDIPNLLVGPPSNIGNELPEAPIRIAQPQVRDGCQQSRTLLVFHGKASLIFGIHVTSSCGRFWMTSARTIVPGRNWLPASLA
jgi:hypothetical protein